MLEKKIENEFVKWCDKQNIVTLKLVMLGQAGFPDRTVLLPNAKVIFIEFKRKNRNKKLAPLQNQWRSSLKLLGFDYFVCDEIGQAESIIKGFL